MERKYRNLDEVIAEWAAGLTTYKPETEGGKESESSTRRRSRENREGAVRRALISAVKTHDLAVLGPDSMVHEFKDIFPRPPLSPFPIRVTQEKRLAVRRLSTRMALFLVTATNNPARDLRSIH